MQRYLSQVLTPKLCYELNDSEFRQQSRDYFVELGLCLKAVRERHERNIYWINSEFFRVLADIEGKLSIRLLEFEWFAKKVAKFAVACLTEPVSEVKNSAANVEIGSTEDVDSELQLSETDLANLM